MKNFYQANHHAFMAHAKTVLLFKQMIPSGKIGASFSYSPSYSIDCNPINAMSKMDFDDMKNSGGWICMLMDVIQNQRLLFTKERNCSTV